MVSFGALKWGGTSVGTPAALDLARAETLRYHQELLKKDSDATTIVVVSGTGKQKDSPVSEKNTDLLEQIVRGENVDRNVLEIKRREDRNASHYGLPQDFNAQNYQLLERYITDTNADTNLRYSRIVAIAGELLKRRQFAAILNLLQPDVAVEVNEKESGFYTTGGHIKASIAEITNEKIREAFSNPKYRGKIAVVAGFCGIDNGTGEISTLARGGSDASVLKYCEALGIREVPIYSDTMLRVADPAVVHYPETIREATYGEVAEFLGYGASIVAPEALDIAERNLIKLLLRDTFHLSSGETAVSVRGSNGKGNIKGIAACDNLVLSLGNLHLEPGEYSRVTDALKRYGIGFTAEAGDNRHSSLVPLDSSNGSFGVNLGHVVEEIRNSGLSFELKNATRIGLIGEGIETQPRALTALGQTFEALGLRLGTITKPENGIALSITTDKTYKGRVVNDLYSR